MIRTFCVAILALLGFLHCIMLFSFANTLENRGIKHYVDGKLPDDFRVAVGLVRDLSQDNLLFVFLLITGFTVLALLPPRSAKEKDKQ